MTSTETAYGVAEDLWNGETWEAGQRWHHTVKSVKEARADFRKAVKEGAYSAVAMDRKSHGNHTVTVLLSLLDSDDEMVEQVEVTESFVW